MAATRLSDSQKTELVERFRAGASSQDLAEAYGCSANTVSRVVRLALGDDDYDRIKRQRSRRRSPVEEPLPAADAATPSAADAPAVAEAEAPVASSPPPAPPAPPVPVAAAAARQIDLPGVIKAEQPEDGPAVLAIDDADDFGGDDDDDLLSGDEDTADEEINPFLPIAVELLPVEPSEGEHQLHPLETASLASSAYMLVEKTVELQARPLHEIPELGGLPAEELERQALVVFLNPRQAKRQCGRNQRVIKVPDLRVLQKTAPYLLAQGISRVVIEGSLYALPGS